jgi:hypothetical protein
VEHRAGPGPGQAVRVNAAPDAAQVVALEHRTSRRPAGRAARRWC